jgi:adenylate cyclase
MRTNKILTSLVQEVSRHGNAIGQMRPSSNDRTRDEEGSKKESPSRDQHHSYRHRFHLPGHQHRHQKSKESSQKISSESGLKRPRTDYDRGTSPEGGPRRTNTELSPKSVAQMPTRRQLQVRATSPLPPSDQSPADSGSGKHKGFFSKVLGKAKGTDPLKSLPHSQKSLQDPPTPSIAVKPDPFAKRDRDPSIATIDSQTTIKPPSSLGSIGRKESRGILQGGKFGPTRRGHRDHGSREEERMPMPPSSESYWALDTDLTSMEGIVSKPPDPAKAVDKLQRYENESWDITPGGTAYPAGWDAPDSWAVKKVGDEDMTTLREMDEEGTSVHVDDTGMPHGVRVFRIDQTFATLSTGVNTTAEEILQILGKKSFLQDELNTYQIVMRKQDLQRQLAPNERPIAIQRRLLEQAGYQASDHIEEVGREDNSYLCRFTFVPTKISGFYSLEKDPGLSRLPRFRDIDLSSRSLVTIPISLYSKSGEIHSLNLSRNLALDIPKDFIQACSALRQLYFTGNEAWQLPPSICLATKLTTLDISNNRLEQLDHADLGHLTALVALRCASNKLTTLPPSFVNFSALRQLDISSNYFKTLPSLIFSLRSLRHLDISFNEIESLPAEIGQLKNLEKLQLTNNKLSGSLPSEIENLQDLKELDIRHNKLQNIDVLFRLRQLENLFIGHNQILKLDGSLQNIKVISAEHNPMTRFNLTTPTPSLTLLDLQDGKLLELEETLFERLPNLKKLTLDKNQLRSLPSQIGALRKLNWLSISRNGLSALPINIGCLTELEHLDLHECNIRTLPAEIWCCSSLKTLNVSSNILESFPKLSPTLQPPTMELLSQPSSSSIPLSPAEDYIGRPEEYDGRRPSQSSSGLLSVGTSPGGSVRKGSIASVFGPNGRQPSLVPRTATADGIAPITRKDSNLNTRVASTFAVCLRTLHLADNRLEDDCFDMITMMPQLRVLNLSYNELDDIPQNALRKWPNLQELYLSGNELNSLPGDDLVRMDTHPLRVLHLNGNKFQTLPAELGKVRRLSVLDVGSNSLKYNVTNWRYDWNWNSNTALKYLNFSGNKSTRSHQLQQTCESQSPRADGRDIDDSVGTGRDRRSSCKELRDFCRRHDLWHGRHPWPVRASFHH